MTPQRGQDSPCPHIQSASSQVLSSACKIRVFDMFPSSQGATWAPVSRWERMVATGVSRLEQDVVAIRTGLRYGYEKLSECPSKMGLPSVSRPVLGIHSLHWM